APPRPPPSRPPRRRTARRPLLQPGDPPEPDAGGGTVSANAVAAGAVRRARRHGLARTDTDEHGRRKATLRPGGPSVRVRPCRSVSVRALRAPAQQRPRVGQALLLLHHQLGGGLAGEPTVEDLAGFGGLVRLVVEESFGEEEMVVEVVGAKRHGPPELGDRLAA